MFICADAMLQGCATESLGTAPAGSNGDAATIYASSRLWTRVPDAMTAAASINSVDGQKTKANTTKVLVPPGHHTVSAMCRYGVSYHTQDLELDAKPGARYALTAVLKGVSSTCGLAIEEVH